MHATPQSLPLANSPVLAMKVVVGAQCARRL